MKKQLIAAGVGVVALTATATPIVMQEIERFLMLREPKVIRGDFNRPNLRFGVEHLRTQSSRLAALEADTGCVWDFFILIKIS